MKLSIIVPVYNMAADRKLNNCLQSLLAQNMSDYEIIAVDDASTDESAEILRQYARKYSSKLKAIYLPENLHQGGARNRGLEEAAGDWVGFVDSDDWVSPDMYPKLLDRAEKTGADLVGCQYCLAYEYTMDPGEPVRIHDPGVIGLIDEDKRRKLISGFGSMVTYIYKREVIVENELSFPEKTFYEDNGASPLWMMRFNHIEIVDEPLYFYYQDPGSTVHTVSMEKLHQRMDVMTSMISEFEERGWSEKYHDELESYFTRLFYVNTLFSYMQSDLKTDMEFLKKLRNGMLKHFPDFRQNKSYKSDYDEEQRRLIDMHMKSPALFVTYYRALHKYRDIRYGKK